jgi:molybdopterin-guanine dinucleotide biosynthesis protein A
MGGRPKALIELGGRRIIERVVAAVAPAVDQLLIVTNAPEHYAFLDLPMVPDVYPDHGSLGGIYSGLRATAGSGAFMVACDMPFLHPDIVRLITMHAGEADVVVPRVGEYLETLHAVYSTACLPHIEANLVAGCLKVTGFFDEVRVLEIPEAECARYRPAAIAFMNVNTPDELSRARRIAEDVELR